LQKGKKQREIEREGGVRACACVRHACGMRACVHVRERERERARETES
jgi:hypothetical protein